MKQNDKFRLEQQTQRRNDINRLKSGCQAVVKSKWKAVVILVYILAAAVLWLFRTRIFPVQDGNTFTTLYMNLLHKGFPILGLFGLLLLLLAFGTPFGGKAIRENLWRVGLCNHAGETPLLLSKGKLKDNPRITVLEFEANGIPLMEWEDKQAKIETALDLNIAAIKEGRGKRRILLYTTPAISELPEVIHWKDGYLDKDSFVLVLGESLLGRVTVNLAQIPHILLGGSTGSGKSVLLKLLLMQCVKKGAKVHIADFKGGVDFPAVWYESCRIITEETELLDTLTGITEELERRKQVFRSAECANIDGYNRKTGKGLPRFVFACDEVAEVLDKTGLSKEDKELVARIESKLSVIARQGRAFGIHLILATQRPDASILAGQIRNNIDFRVCGRADNVLSQIILDNTAASEQIPKDAQGRFILGDGTVFQGYLFDEKAAFGGTGL